MVEARSIKRLMKGSVKVEARSIKRLVKGSV